MIESFNDHREVGEGDIQVPRWSRLLSWLKSHGMDLSPSVLHVERRKRAGAKFLLLFPPTLEINRKTPRNDTGAGHGLFLTSPCQSQKPLFSIPLTALMNVKTLAPLYPHGKHLSAHQLISLHLYLHKPPDDINESIDNQFGPFISILPREFNTHPLIWLVQQTLGGDNELESTLLSLLPRSTRDSLNSLAGRFKLDSDAVIGYLNSDGALGKLNIQNYLWAWLNVNTRCIYMRIKETPTDEANVTLCPILDFSNHDWRHSHVRPVFSSRIWSTRPKAEVPFQFLATENLEEMEVGKEICLRYGGHSNQRLFVEYGFVNTVSNEDMESGTYPAEADVQAIVIDLFERQGAVGLWMRRILENEGYWGDWALSTSPAPASPSFRLIAALRLLAMCSQMASVPTADEEDVVCKPWRDTLLGKTDTISPDNEVEWRKTLTNICNFVIEEGAAGFQRTSDTRFDHWNHSWSEWVRGNIVLLWSEQVVVAKAVLRSLESGVEF